MQTPFFSILDFSNVLKNQPTPYSIQMDHFYLVAYVSGIKGDTPVCVPVLVVVYIDWVSAPSCPAVITLSACLFFFPNHFGMCHLLNTCN